MLLSTYPVMLIIDDWSSQSSLWQHCIQQPADMQNLSTYSNANLLDAQRFLSSAW